MGLAYAGGYCWRAEYSLAPFGTTSLPTGTHGLRRGLHSYAAPRLCFAATAALIARARNASNSIRLRRIVRVNGRRSRHSR
jgi:hypothetical protein